MTMGDNVSDIPLKDKTKFRPSFFKAHSNWCERISSSGPGPATASINQADQIRADNMRVRYATMIVKDMGESIKFYTEVMGFQIDGRHEPRPGVCITLLKGEGDAMIEIIEDTEHEIGLFSLGMEVKDLNATLEELRSKGAKITMGPVPITVGTLAFLEDPNGVKIALIQHGP